MRFLRAIILSIGMMALATACGGGNKGAQEPTPPPAEEGAGEGGGEEGGGEEGGGEEGGGEEGGGEEAPPADEGGDAP